MEQYISKSALVAEIEKIIPQRAYERETLHSEFVRGQRVAYNEVLSLIDTLKVKSADLDVMQRMEECPYRNVGCNIGTIDVGGVTVDRAEFNKKVKELIYGTKPEHKEDTHKHEVTIDYKKFLEDIIKTLRGSISEYTCVDQYVISYKKTIINYERFKRLSR